MLDIESSNHGGPCPSFVHAHIILARLGALGGERMQRGEEPKIDDAKKEIAALLKCAVSTAAVNSTGSPETWVTHDEDIP